MAIPESELEAIVRRVVGELHGAPASTPAPAAAASAGREPLAATGRNGLFATVPEAVDAARRAQRELTKGGVAARQTAIAAIRQVGLDQAEPLARAAHEETGLGRVRDKVAKMQLAANALGRHRGLRRAAGASPGSTASRSRTGCRGAWSRSVTPTNSPSAFMINHGITMIAGGNAVAFNAHPGCRWTSMRTVELMNQAVVAAGGPDNLMTGVVAPSLDSARELVTHAGVDMLCITGGAELVRDAFGTGKRVIAAGPGMPISVVDDTADVRWAAAEILKGAIFDNTILCIGEKAVVAADGVYRPLLDAFAELPAHVLSADETERVYRAVIDDDGKGHRRTRREFVGRDAEVLLAAAGISSRKPVGLLVAPVEREHPLFWMEQFCPFLPVVRAKDSDAAIDLGIEAEGHNRHTAMIYSNFPPNVERFAREISTVVDGRERLLAARPRRRGRGLSGLRDRHRHGRGHHVAAALRAGAPRRADPVTRDADIELIVRIVLRVLEELDQRRRRAGHPRTPRRRPAGCCAWRPSATCWPPTDAGVLRLARGAVITPLAREAAEAKGVRLVVPDAARARRRPRQRRPPDRGARSAPAAGRAQRSAPAGTTSRSTPTAPSPGELVVTASAAAARMSEQLQGIAVDLAVIAVLDDAEVPAA